MCACAFKNGSRQFLVNQGYSTIISAPAFASGNTYSEFMFYRCISEPKFLATLSTVKVGDSTLDKEIKTEVEVKKLAELADTGEDVKLWGVSVKSLLGAIKFDQDELDNAQCKIAFSND